MSKMELIYTIAIAVVVLVILIYLLVMAIKNGWIKKVIQTLNNAIKYAEKNITGNVEKKNYVMDKVEEKCTELGIPWFLIRKPISKLIDKIIADYNVIDH